MFDLVKRLSVLQRLRGALRHDMDQAIKPLRKEVRRLSSQVAELETALAKTAVRAARGDREAQQVKLTLRLNAAAGGRLAELERLLTGPGVAAHVREAIAAAPLFSSPLDHIVVNQLLPGNVYDVLLASIPPLVFFTENDPVKQDLPIPMEFGPAYHLRVWDFVHQELSQDIIRPAVMEKFHDRLQEHYDVIFGPGAREQANRLPPSTSGGRLMLRRPGYHLDPHRDPKRSLLTCLLYLARPGENEAYGTQLFGVHGDGEAHYKQTYYPQREGHRCELMKVVPFRPNSMLVFLNSRGAHGADIPKDAPPDVERHSYQFYIAPENAALASLLKSLPETRRERWKNRSRVVWNDAMTDPADGD